MKTKRIFIAGHGAVLNTIKEIIDADVTSYVDEGAMFNYYFTPAFIQAIVQGEQKAGFNIDKLINEFPTQVTIHKATNIQKNIEVNKHLLFLSESDVYPICARGFNSTKYGNVCNIGGSNFLYSFICKDGPFLNLPCYKGAKFEARYGNSQYAYVLSDKINKENLLNEDSILIWPTKTGDPSQESESEYASLGEIVRWVKNTYPDDQHEFYWFACRNYI